MLIRPLITLQRGVIDVGQAFLIATVPESSSSAQKPSLETATGRGSLGLGQCAGELLAILFYCSFLKCPRDAEAYQSTPEITLQTVTGTCGITVSSTATGRVSRGCVWGKQESIRRSASSLAKFGYVSLTVVLAPAALAGLPRLGSSRLINLMKLLNPARSDSLLQGQCSYAAASCSPCPAPGRAPGGLQLAGELRCAQSPRQDLPIFGAGKDSQKHEIRKTPCKQTESWKGNDT